ncbi:hypothetical protein DPSP01_013691 [Paraphaeosphaeria sporulosa]
MDPLLPTDLDTTDQHLSAMGTIDCSQDAHTCNNYSPSILAAFIAGVSILVLLCVLVFYMVRAHDKKVLHQRRASTIFPLYLGSGRDGRTGAGDDLQLRRLSHRVSMPLPMHVQRMGSGAAEVAGAPPSVGSSDTEIRRELSPSDGHWVSSVRADNNNFIVFYDPSRAMDAGNDATVVLNEVTRFDVPRTPSVDTLPKYEEVEAEGGWKKERLPGGVGQAAGGW